MSRPLLHSPEVAHKAVQLIGPDFVEVNLADGWVDVAANNLLVPRTVDGDRSSCTSSSQR